MTSFTIDVKRELRAAKQAAANEFRQRMAAQGTCVIRLISSPGAGKTSLLAETAKRMRPQNSIAILVGDVETDRDQQRLAPFAPTVQITTGGACHLELSLVQSALPKLNLATPADFLFLEDIGNLICPASHDLGEHLRVLLLSSTEGDDKPQKYPKAVRTSQMMVITKSDLLPHVPFNVEHAVKDAQAIQPEMNAIVLSSLTGHGIEAWCNALLAQREKMLACE